jgi:hypothetical protein
MKIRKAPVDAYGATRIKLLQWHTRSVVLCPAASVLHTSFCYQLQIVNSIFQILKLMKMETMNYPLLLSIAKEI